MDTADFIDQGIAAAVREQREISDTVARAIADQFHDASALTLSFVSTGFVPADMDDLYRALVPDYHALPSRERRWANWLGTYLVHAPREQTRERWSDLSW